MAKHQLRNSFYHPHKRVTTTFRKPSRTKQEFKEDADINVIMRRFAKTGVLPQMQHQTPRYVDAAEMPDLQTALHIIQDAQKHFMSLPANVRKEFDNDPMKYVEFAQKPENIEKLREWGLAPKPEPEPKPTKVEIVNQTPPAAPAG